MVLKPSLICFVFRDHFGRAENAPVRCPMRAGPAPTFPQTSELYPCSGQRERGARDERRRRDSRMRSNSHYPHHRDSESRDQNAMPLSVRRKRFWPYAQYFRDRAARECPTIGSSVDPAGETRQRVASSAGLGKGSDTSRTAERYIEYDCPSQLLELQLTDTDTRNFIHLASPRLSNVITLDCALGAC